MQFSLLETNLMVVRSFLPFEVPQIYYEPSCLCFHAHSLVTSDVTNKPLQELRGHLLGTAQVAKDQLKAVFPEVSERDFRMTVAELDLSPEHPPAPPKTIAEYANGELTLK
jgi:hypothetical protein